MTLALKAAYPTPMGHSTLIPLLLLSLARQRHSPDGSKRIKREYDYVIVGGGTAGSVLASRLSEKPCVSVLLLEAGDQPPLLTEVPALAKYFRSTDVAWKHRTVPQKYAGKALVNRQVPWSSGKMLGGSSSLDNMISIRGNRKNYDEWESEGAKGWSYKDVFPYFLKLENNKDYTFLKNGYHARGGPVTVHQPRYESELKRAVYKAADDLGFKIVDSNAAKQTGFYEHQGSLKDSQRCSTAKAYLVPAENRTNLDILPKALATKIIISKRKARGVRFEFRSHSYVVRAKREVIVSAGTVNTAQLLMLSGVGPKKELEKLHIPVVADLPVGQNLQDAGQVPLPYILSSHIPNFVEKISDPDNIEQYIHNRTGPLASTSGIEFVAFLKGGSTHHHVDSPNYEIEFAEMTAYDAKRLFGLKPEVYKKLYGPYEKEPLFMCLVSQLQPRSRGSVTLRSKNPYRHPNIDPNYLADPRDVDDLVEGMKTCDKIAANRHLEKLGVRPFKTSVPGCEKYAYDEDDYFRCYAKSILTTAGHPVGTAKIGGPWDPTAVVDPKLRVKNIKNLRVVDDSIMPKIPSGHSTIPTIMVAEKASDIIKETINCYKSWDEPKKTMEWSEDDEDDEEWKKPQDEEIIWVEEGEHWEKPKHPTWEDEEEQWEKPKDEDSWEDHEEQWEKPKDKVTIWVEDNLWKKPEDVKWEKPKGEEMIYVDHHQWKKPEEVKWEKPKDEEFVYVEDKWKHPEEVKWGKHKDEEIIHVEDHKWKNPEEIKWEEPKDKETDQWKKPEEIKWKEPKDKEIIYVEDKWKKPEEVKWKKPEEVKWEKLKEDEILYVEDKWEKPKGEDTVWLKDDYTPTEVPKHVWDIADKVSWQAKGKEPKDYLKPPIQVSVSGSKTDYENVYQDVPNVSSWTHDSTYQTNSEQPEKLPVKLADNAESLPLSWYNQQTDIHMHKYKEITPPELKKTESSIHWGGPESYTTSKSTKEQAWENADVYKEANNVKELVKLADRGPESTTLKISDDYDEGHEGMKSMKELIKLASLSPVPSTEHTDTSPKIRWY